MLLAHPKEEKKARLLCVDDDLSFLLGFTAVLQAAGYSVVATNDPCQAFELVTNAAFDLVIVDYDMPHINGGELASRLKQHKRDLPVILFSGSDSIPPQALARVDEHLIKGEDVKAVLQTVRAQISSVTQSQSEPGTFIKENRRDNQDRKYSEHRRSTQERRP